MKRQVFFLGIYALFAILLFSSWKVTDRADMEDVLKKADFYRGGQVPGVAWELVVQNVEQGEVKDEIGLLVEAASGEDYQYVLITFMEPRKYTGQKLLVRDNSMWFVKKGLRNPVPISSRQRLTGSASNADVATANYYKDYEIQSSEEGEFQGTSCWILDLEAKNNLVSYSKIKYWISQDKNFGLHAEYYGKSGKLIKEASFDYTNKVEYQNKEYDYLSKIIISDSMHEEDKTYLTISPARFTTFNNSKFQKDRLMD